MEWNHKEDIDSINLNDLLGSGQISSAVSDIWSIFKPKNRNLSMFEQMRKGNKN